MRHASAAIKEASIAPAQGVMRERFHLVDIAEFNSNGICSCEFFECGHGPKLRGMSSVEQAMGKHRCQHIEAARSFALDVALKCHHVERYAGSGRQREEAV